MKRAAWLILLGAAVLGLVPYARSQRANPSSYGVVEATIPQMRAALDQGRVTSRDLVMQYLARIGMYEDQLHAVLTVNPRALEEADQRDWERISSGGTRGPLHGIPIAVKDNVLTRDIVTTGGALAFTGYTPPYDATLVKNLRDAGAVIIAKTTMTELANWVAGAPTPMPGNYNAVRGFALNPYDPRRDPREATGDGRPALATGGSSSGAGTAMAFGPRTWEPKPRGPSSALRIKTCWRGSSPLWGGSAATASSRSAPIRIRPGRWREP